MPIVAIPALTVAAFMYFRGHLPDFCLENAERIVATSGALTLALVIMAWFRRSRAVTFMSGQLRYRSWLTDKTIAVSRITNATFETELSGGDQTLTEHYLSLWSGDELLLRFNAGLWPRDGLAALLRAIQQHNPAVRLDHAVDRYATLNA